MVTHHHNDDLRQEIAEYLGFNYDTNVPLAEVLDRTEEQGYTRVSLEYTGRGGQRVPAFELVPHGPGPFPGVLILHQHASRWDLGKSEVCGLAGDQLQAFGPALARRGVCMYSLQTPSLLRIEGVVAALEGSWRHLAFKTKIETVIGYNTTTRWLTGLSAETP